MAQATRPNTTRFPIAATAPDTEVIDLLTGEVISAAEARRRALLRREWAAYDQEGRAL